MDWRQIAIDIVGTGFILWMIDVSGIVQTAFKNIHRHTWGPWKESNRWYVTVQNPVRMVGLVIEQERQCQTCGYVKHVWARSPTELK